MGIVGNTSPITSARRSRHFTTLVCPDCAGITVIEHTALGTQDKIIAVSPENADRALDVDHLPEKVAKYYDSARRAMSAGLPDAAAVQLRRTLEAAAQEYDVSERTLVKSIEKLIEDGHVTKQFGDVFHLVRKVGNLGAHASDDEVDTESASRILTFTTQILRNLFEVPEELRRLSNGDEQTDSPGTE